jgi:hypothetical protein
MLAYLCNTAWMASCLREARAFDRDARKVRGIQSALLRRIVQRHRSTWFGNSHAFAKLRTIHDFQDAVPISTYDDYRAPIERIGAGERNVLTADDVLLLEPTGGSSDGEKLIPYTAALQNSFQRAIRTWIWDLYSKRPNVRRGRAYWSISPISADKRRTPAGIPIGFEDDTAYLGRFSRRLAKQTIVAPSELSQCPSVAAAQYATLFFLLRAADLSLVSVWSPTFLTELFKLLPKYAEQLCDDIASGQIRGENCPVEGPIATQRYRSMSHRAEYLRRLFRHCDNVTQCVSLIWPRLDVVSCWADGPSLVHANNLRRFIPLVELQPKGVLATESFVTIPLLEFPAPALAIRSHFFEFLPVDSGLGGKSLRALLADELEGGGRYRVIVTTEGGLYRYQLHDEVEVVGFMFQVPLLRFLGKTDEICDLVGEKIDAAHAQYVLQIAFRELNLSPTYSLLRAVSSPSPRYVLQIAAPMILNDLQVQRQLRDLVEQGLSSNSAYRYARDLNQLSSLQIQVMDHQQAELLSSNHTCGRLGAGQRLGNIKPMTVFRA